jgi:hypothetical protein
MAEEDGLRDIEYEHANGQIELTRLEKLAIKKANLRRHMGAERFDRLYGEATQFLKLNKKEILRGEVCKEVKKNE